jgi:plasmid stabilization system protein ParE
MTYRVVVTSEAEQDLDQLFQYVAHDNPAAARKFVAGLRKRLKTLASMPRRCPRAPEDGLDGLEIRHLVHGQYRVIFAIDSNTVVILQVRHGARLPTTEG